MAILSRAWAAIDSAIGPARRLADGSAEARAGSHVIAIRLIKVSRGDSGGGKLFEFACPLRERAPVLLRAGPRDVVSMRGPLVESGDADFDAALIMTGWPETVVQSGLTPRVKEIFRSKKWPPLEISDGAARFTLSPLALTQRSPEALRHQVEQIIAASEAFSAAFYNELERIRAERGEDAAARFVEDLRQAERLSKRHSSQRLTMIIVIAIVASLLVAMAALFLR